MHVLTHKSTAAEKRTLKTVEKKRNPNLNSWFRTFGTMANIRFSQTTKGALNAAPNKETQNSINTVQNVK